jgi:hypothetical protein
VGERIKNLFSAVLAVLYSIVVVAGCYLLGIGYSLSIGITLLTGGLTGLLALCLNGVIAGSTIQYSE